MTHLFAMIVLAVVAEVPGRQGAVPDRLDLTKVRAIAVQHDGRWMPLDTLARDMVGLVTGDEEFRKRDPVSMFLAWTFAPETWKDQPLVRIYNRQLRKMLELPADREYFSYEELSRHEPLNRLIDAAMERRGDQKPDPLETKIAEINRKLGILSDIFAGRVIKVVPNPDEPYGPWKALVISSEEAKSGVKDPLKRAWVHLGRTFLDNDAQAFSQAVDTFISSLASLPSAYRPDPKLIASEVRYNRGHFFRLAWVVLLVGACLGLAGTVLRRKWVDAVAFVGLAAGFGVLTFGLILRWRIAGHIPASNMFESLLFLSWGAAGFAILSILTRSNPLVALTSSVLGAVALILADCLPIDHFIRPIAPVLLDTVWMSIHVPVIMISYAVLTLAVLVAHAQLVVMAIAPGRQTWIGRLDRLHYGYVYAGSFLLLAGIITGSMWAASSWGRYWGWDPKEVWSLVALLGYLAILHVRIDRTKIPAWAYAVAGVLGLAVLFAIASRLAPSSITKVLVLSVTGAAMVLFVTARGVFATALKSILAFWMIVMTYVGVNYVLGIGLHSYAFGTGAVVRHLLQIGIADLLLVGLCSVIYLGRRSVPVT